jgi:hypothetical protein
MAAVISGIIPIHIARESFHVNAEDLQTINLMKKKT